MKIKTYILAAFFGISLQAVHAQQLPQFSQYMQNMYVLNPAASSLEKDIDVNLGFRQQWAGFEGAPQTYYAQGSVNLGKKPEPQTVQYSIPISRRDLFKNVPVTRYAKHVVSGMAAVDEYGLFKRNSVMAGYSYHLPFGEKYWLALGTSMGWYGLNFGMNKVILENPTDNTYADFTAHGTQSNLFDINAGAYVYSDRFFGGYSIYQIAQNEINLGNKATADNFSEAKLRIHHFATAGYRISVSPNFDLTPSAMVKILGPAPFSIDINLKADIYQKLWFGFSYRNEDAISILAGLHISEWMRVGYAYDYVTSTINNLSSGSHEVVLGLRFNRKSN